MSIVLVLLTVNLFGRPIRPFYYINYAFLQNVKIIIMHMLLLYLASDIKHVPELGNFSI